MTVFDALAEHAALPFERARMLPVEAYRSEAVRAEEFAELFGRDWLCVARTADLRGPGDHRSVELPGPDGARSIIVVRADDGTIRAFDNVCLHRGAPLVIGPGTASRFTCPYHAWVYRLDGTLVGAPYMQGATEADGTPFDTSCHRLAELPVETWQGFVFVSQDPDSTPLATRLTGLDEVVARYGMARYEPVRTETEVWSTNWKLLVENFLDAYHVFHVHRESFGADGDSTDETEVHAGTLDWTHHRVVHRAIPDLAAPANPLTGDWRTTVVIAAVFPNLVVQLQPDWMWSLQLAPIGTDRVRIESRVAVAPETLDEVDDSDAWLADLFDLIDRVNGEDRPVVERVRANLDRPQFERAPLSSLERNVYDFDRYVATRLTRVD